VLEQAESNIAKMQYNSKKKLRIITGENAMYRHTPLHEAIIYAAKKSGMAGATLYRGIMSYGEKSQIRSFRFFALSQDLPVVIEIIDSEKKIIEFLEILKKMMEKCNEKGLITVESTSVIQFE